MAPFYGSASVNLTPLLFRGNKKSTGINVIIHNDISYSMYYNPNGTINYFSTRTAPTGSTNVSAGSTSSMFYDGFFIQKLQDYLRFKKIGDKAATPNIYAYFDENTRRPTTSFSITNNSTTLNISDIFIKGETDTDIFGSTGTNWRTGYINNGGPYNNTTNYFNKANIGNRQNLFTLTSANQSPLSEDVHGNLWSIFYSGNTSSDTIGSGEAGDVGKVLLNRARKDLPTFVITASNEQENSPASMLNQLVATKENANFRLTLDRTIYAKPGLRVVRFDNYFDEFVGPTGEVETDWYNTAQFLPEGTILDASAYVSPPYIGWSPNDANIGIGSTNIYTTSSTIGAGTSIFNFPPREDDIIDCSYMFIGYFRPNADGTWKFGTRSNEKSFIWIDDETDLTNNESLNRTSIVVTGWNYANAKVQNSTSRTPNGVVSAYSANLTFRAGKLYPIRILFGNRSYKATDTTNFPSSAQGPSAGNRSELTVFFERGSGSFTPTNVNDSVGSFFGAEDVWKPGSEFLPPPIIDVNKTIRQEVIDKNYRIIALSSYKQLTGSDYDGVFFRKDGSYRYINFGSGGSYTPTDNSTELVTWDRGNYYNPVGYAVSANFIDNRNAFGIGASIFVDKYNSYYIATVNSLSQGSGYRIGDRISIAGTTLGETTNPANNLLLEVTEVEDSIYQIPPIVSSNQENSIYITPTNTSARFEIIKNPSSSGAIYTKTNNGVRLSNAGAGYTTNDRLLISGFQLDGTNTNDVDIIVTNVSNTGQILDFGLGYLGNTLNTPTNYIDYTSIPTTYNPQSITGIAYSTVGINSVGYTTSIVSGIAYTTASITGIAYTNASITGIAFTTYNVDSIDYNLVQTSATIVKNSGNNPYQVTSTSHGLSNGDYVSIDGSGNTNIDNKTFTITVIDPDTFSLNEPGNVTGGQIGPLSIFYIRSNPGSTDYATVTSVGHGLVDGNIIDIIGTGAAGFNATFTVTNVQPDTFSLVGTSTSPFYESSIPIPSSSGTAILRADGVLTIASNPNNSFVTGVGVSVVSTTATQLNRTYTLQQISTLQFSLVPTVAIPYPLPTNSTGGHIGLLNAPAIVTTSGAHPFINGQNIQITGTGANFDGSYTITTTNYATNRFALNGKVNPPSYTVTTSSGTVGLRDSNPVVTTTTPHQLNTGNTAVIQDCTNTFFNGTYSGITVYTPTTFGLVGKQNPTSYASANNGLVGINSEVIVTTTSNHNLFDGNVINISGNTAASFNGTRTIKNVLSPTSFTLVGTANTTDYRVRGTGGVAGLTNLGAIVTSANHNLTSGITVNISGYTVSPQTSFNGSRTVATVLDANRFTLTGTANTTNYLNSPGTASFVITSGAGSGAQFGIRRVLTSNTTAKYTLNSISPGSGYRIGDRLLITGNYMGGANPTNNSIVTVSTINGTGGILTVDSLADGTINGTADPSLDYSDINGNAIQFTPQRVAGSGTNSNFTVTRDGTTTYKVTLNNGGQDYYINDRIRINGNDLGGINGTNDLFLTVTSTSPASGGVITGIGTTGIAAFGAPIKVTGITTVSTSSTFSRPYNLELDGGILEQRHETYELAKDTNGGLFKIDRIFVQGDPLAGIASVDNRESFAAALADFIDENR